MFVLPFFWKGLTNGSDLNCNTKSHYLTILIVNNEHALIANKLFFCINSFISYSILQFIYLRSLCWQFRNMGFEAHKWNMIQMFSFENLWKISTIWTNWWKLDHSSCQICSSTLLYCPIRLYCCIFLCWGSDEVFFWSSRFGQLCPGGLRPVADHSIMLDVCFENWTSEEFLKCKVYLQEDKELVCMKKSCLIKLSS